MSNRLTKPEAPGEATQHEPSWTYKGIIVRVLAHDQTWWWRLLRLAQAWCFFIPWPLPYVLYMIPSFRRHFLTPRKRWTMASGWLTVCILFWLAFVFLLPANASRDDKYAAEAAKILFSGAFLLGTILSVSVALPGQAVIKTVIATKPEAVVDFVVPFLWALMWGISGAIALMFLPGIGNLHPKFRYVAIFFGLYGSLMEVNAMGHTIRMYTIGLLLWGDDEAKKRKKEKTEAAAALGTDAHGSR